MIIRGTGGLEAGGGRPGNGSRPAAIVTFGGAAADTLENVVLRVNGVYWQERSLVVQTLRHTGSQARQR